jgi:hypothetical protein
MVQHLNSEVPSQRHKLLFNRLLRQIIDMVASATQYDVHPCSHGIRYEEHKSSQNQPVVPAKVASEIARPYSKEDCKRSDDCESTHNGQNLALSAFDHGTAEFCRRSRAILECSVRKWATGVEAHGVMSSVRLFSRS